MSGTALAYRFALVIPLRCTTYEHRQARYSGRWETAHLAPTPATASMTAPGSSRDTNVFAPGTSIRVEFGNSASILFARDTVKQRSAIPHTNTTGLVNCGNRVDTSVRSVALTCRSSFARIAADARVRAAGFEPRGCEGRVWVSGEQAEAERRVPQRFPLHLSEHQSDGLGSA